MLQEAHNPEHSHALPAAPASLPGCNYMQVENVELIRAYGHMLKLVLMRGKLLQQLKSAIAALQKAADNQSAVPVALERACHDIKKKVAEVDEDIAVRQGSAECVVASLCPCMTSHKDCLESGACCTRTCICGSVLLVMLCIVSVGMQPVTKEGNAVTNAPAHVQFDSWGQAGIHLAHCHLLLPICQPCRQSKPWATLHAWWVLS